MKKEIRNRIFVAIALFTPLLAAPAQNLIPHGGFESTVQALKEVWSPKPASTNLILVDEPFSGERSLRVAMKNEGATASETLFTHTIREGINPESEYVLSFQARQLKQSPGYLQEYAFQWFDSGGQRLDGDSRGRWMGGQDEWKEVSAKVASPADAASLALTFRFVTGAIEGCHGEALLDDVDLQATGVKVRSTRSVRVVQSTSVATSPAVGAIPGARTIIAQGGLSGSPLVLGAKPEPQSAEELDAAAKEAWTRIEEALEKGLNTMERAQLTLLTRDLSVAQRSLGSDVKFREARELIYLHLFYPEGSDGYYRAAERWISNYPDSERGRDLFLSLLYGRLDDAQFSDAQPLIETFLKRYPDDEERAALKMIQERLPLYIQAFEGL